MPSPLDMAKSAIRIDSFDDIPRKYKDSVIDRATTGPDRNYIGNIIEGKRGKETNQVQEEFNDSNLVYFGHGTPDKEVVDNILKEGLSVKNSEDYRFYDNNLRGLDSTTITLGYGSNYLFNKYEDTLNNWPHKGSKNIVIISLPENYCFTPTETNINSDYFETFYIGNEKEGYKLRPEFIKGVYNSTEKTFTENENFYKNLSEDKQKELFNEIDNNYIKVYSEISILSPTNFDRELPISNDKIDKLNIEWYAKQARDLNRYYEEIQRQRDLYTEDDDEEDKYNDFEWDETTDELSDPDWDDEEVYTKHR